LIALVGQISALAGAEVLKQILPWQALVPADTSLSADLRQETYPSGHTTFGTSVALAFYSCERGSLAPVAGSIARKVVIRLAMALAVLNFRPQARDVQVESDRRHALGSIKCGRASR
jgi:membrane-associated phospholipid phosphatase